MKLIEKLAQDYAIEADKLIGMHPDEESFMAGFRKAREMAADMCRKDILGGYGYHAAQDIMALGEEDITTEKAD